MRVKDNAAQIIGKIFIVLGAIGFIVILFSFDWGYYNSIKDSPNVYSNEVAFMKGQLLTTWTYAIVLLIGSSAVGVVLMTLGKILGHLEIITKDKRVSIAHEENIKNAIKKESEVEEDINFY